MVWVRTIVYSVQYVNKHCNDTSQLENITAEGKSLFSLNDHKKPVHGYRRIVALSSQHKLLFAFDVFQ
jgi:hypothetical protein